VDRGGTILVAAAIPLVSAATLAAEAAARLWCEKCPSRCEAPSARRDRRGVGQLVSGLGLVVGLNGTGGGELAPQIQATMERELARGGIGKGGVMDTGPLAGMSPRQVLRDPNVAVVIVEAPISPGWPKGYRFDVRVRALPGSTVTSLEGGTLWTTELRIGPATTLGGVKAHQIGQARGPVFINPFATPGKAGADAVTRTSGRILGGGDLTEPLKLELVLDNPSHSMARSITSSIPASRGTRRRRPTARGRNADSVAVQVPHAFTQRPGGVHRAAPLHPHRPGVPAGNTPAVPSSTQAVSRAADDISLCLQAIGKTAVPFLYPMYEYPELPPRMAAAGGGPAEDPRTAPYLIELARSGPAATRTDAIALLGRLPVNPRINQALWAMIDAKELDVRVAAYEALAARGDWGILRTEVDGRFGVDVVPSQEGLIYVTQQGLPRIVAFGGGLDAAEAAVRGPGAQVNTGLRLHRPLMVSAWSDRLMLAADTDTDQIRLRYRDFRGGGTISTSLTDSVPKLIDYLGHKTTPEDDRPAFGLPYPKSSGASYEMQRGAIDAAFATERDKLQAEVPASKSTTIVERPENTGDKPPEPAVVFKPEEEPAALLPEAGTKPTWVVPLSPPKSDKGHEEEIGSPDSRFAGRTLFAVHSVANNDASCREHTFGTFLRMLDSVTR
jgi:hypothetical protein